MSEICYSPEYYTKVWDWRSLSLCRGMDSSFFFHPEGERGQTRSRREKRAKQICHQCPVMAQCRTHALSTEEPYGVWGGLSESERKILAKRQRISA